MTPEDKDVPEVGMRVGAVLSADSQTKVITFLGFGVYEGRYPLEDAAGQAGQMFSGLLNPRIKLDSGKTVWGAECWWGPEEDMQTRLAFYKYKGWTQVDADIEQVRAEWREQHPEESGG